MTHSVTNFQMLAVLGQGHLDFYQDVPKWKAGKKEQKESYLLLYDELCAVCKLPPNCTGLKHKKIAIFQLSI
jgi:hypothetical protein